MKRNFISILAALTLIGLLGLAEMSLAVEGTWMKKADMPTARWGLSTSVVNGKIYAIGGATALKGGITLAAVEEYDPATDTWAKKGDMPAPTDGLSASLVNGKIYAFGGVAQRGGAPLSTLFQYDPATDTWTTKDDMPVRMTGMGTSVVGGRIYVVGGSSAPYPYSPFLSTVWEYETGFAPVSPEEAVPVEETKSVEPGGKLVMMWGRIRSK